jgi:glyoxylase-like metal-dependent hydrolase (beta-lactamase superfamily II)
MPRLLVRTLNVMSVTKVTDTLYQITKYAMVNCYLVIERDGGTLVDTGIAGMGKMLLKAAAHTGQPIRRILLTHAHVDHAGALDEVAGLLPEAEILLSPRTERLLSGDLSLEAGEPQSPPKGGFPRRNTRATRQLSPDGKIGSLRIIPAPGHSPDQLAFLDERDGTLIAGDAFQTKGGIAVSGVLRWRFPLPALATWSLRLATESATRLADLAPTRLCPGHGRVLEEPEEAMRRAIGEAEKKLEGR